MRFALLGVVAMLILMMVAVGVMRRVCVVVVVRIRVLVKALLAVKHEEIHAERIESRDKHTRQYRK